MNQYERYSEDIASQTFFNDLREEITKKIYLWEDSLRDKTISDDWEKENSTLNKEETDNVFSISLDSHKKIIEEKEKKIDALEKEIRELKSISSEVPNVDLENMPITCGPYEIAKGKKTAFMSVIWALKELNFFVKQKDGSYATNRSDVIDSFLTKRGNADQLLPKALKTDTFMNVFNDMLDKASEIYSKDKK